MWISLKLGFLAGNAKSIDRRKVRVLKNIPDCPIKHIDTVAELSSCKEHPAEFCTKLCLNETDSALNRRLLQTLPHDKKIDWRLNGVGKDTGENEKVGATCASNTRLHIGL